jgi:hypothetical protein
MTRQNLCPNPAAKNNATGYASNGTFAQASDFPTPASPRSTGVRMSTGGYLQCPTAVCAPGDVFTVSFYQHNGSASFQFGRTVYIGYTRSAGGDTFPETFNTGALGDVDVVARTSFTTAAAPALATGVYVLWDSLVAGLGMTGVLLEKVAALDTYADGDTSGWVWDGADGNSTSSEAPTIPTGTAALGLGLAVASIGAAPAEGVAGVGLGLAVASAGAARAEGVVALSLGLGVTSTGARESLGAAALGLSLNVVSAGERASLGASALGLNLAVAARGLNGTSGRPVSHFPWTPRPVSGYPWTPRPVRSFEEVTES